MTQIRVTCYMGHTVWLGRKTLQKLGTRDTEDSRAGRRVSALPLDLHCRQVSSLHPYLPCPPPGSASGSGLSPGSFQGAGGESVESLGNYEGRSRVNDRELGHRHEKEEKALMLSFHFENGYFLHY